MPFIVELAMAPIANEPQSQCLLYGQCCKKCIECIKYQLTIPFNDEEALRAHSQLRGSLKLQVGPLKPQVRSFIATILKAFFYAS